MPVYAKGTIVLPAENADMILTQWDQHVRLSRAENGCVRFDYSVSDDRTTITLDEKWRDKHAFAAHAARTRLSPWADQSASLTRDIQITGSALARDIQASVIGWTPPPAPPSDLTLTGTRVRLERLDATRHGPYLFDENTRAANWDYLPYGPFATKQDYHDWIKSTCTEPDPHFFAIINQATDRPVGVASYLRINPQAGSIEVGHIHFAPALQQTTGATEAMFVMMQWAFEAGYRRYEWKCNAANLASRRAAERLGLSFEGVFRQMMIVKGHNRDTAWYAAIDAEWPALHDAFKRWLAPGNFAGDGRQMISLSDLTRPIRVADDPVLRD